MADEDTQLAILKKHPFNLILRMHAKEKLAKDQKEVAAALSQEHADLVKMDSTEYEINSDQGILANLNLEKAGQDQEIAKDQSAADVSTGVAMKDLSGEDLILAFQDANAKV